MVALQSTTGFLLAIIAALFAAVYQLLVRVSTESGDTNDALIIILIVNSSILLPLGIIWHTGTFFEPVTVLYFVAAGLSGSMAGRAFNYMGIEKIGASRTSPITSANTLLATFLGIVVLKESYTALHIVGVVAIVIGIVYISYETSRHNPGNISRETAMRGLTFALLAFFFYGLEPIFAKLGLVTGMPFITGLAVKTIAAGIGFYLYLRWAHAVPALTFSNPNMRMYVLAGVVNTAFVLSYYAALQTAPVVLVHPIISTYTLFVIFLSYLFMPKHLERITIGLLLGALITAIGIALISMAPG